ncbi:MAG: hypothetical protein OXG96_04375 [Acidobacteria bacterium]|nr:hypothetical protein [Acidobacteriota bacterium]
MSPELAQWINPAILIAGFLYVLRSMKQMESRLESRMDRMESRVREDMKRLDERVARLEHSQAKLEGLLEGLREAITRQPAA